MNKEQIIEKLEVLFETACDQFINGYPENYSLSEIISLSQIILDARTNIESNG